jgi:hypothetical protein
MFIKKSFNYSNVPSLTCCIDCSLKESHLEYKTPSYSDQSLEGRAWTFRLGE